MADILIYDPIADNDIWEEGLVTPRLVQEQLDALPEGEEINLRVNSPGGDAFAGIAIRTMLDKHPATVRATVEGLAASAATVPILAAESVEMAPGSMLMIHKPWAVTVGNDDEHLSSYNALQRIGRNVADLYAERGSESSEAFLELMAAETWLLAQEAVDVGLADTIGESGVAACTQTRPQMIRRVEEGKLKLKLAAKRREIQLTRARLRMLNSA